MLTVPDNRNEDNLAVADAPPPASAGEGVGRAGDDGPRDVPPTLDTLAREGARRMLMTALEAEVGEYIERFAEVRDADGHRLVVRNGQAQERTVTCGAGTWPVRAPRGERQAGRCRRLARAVHEPHSAALYAAVAAGFRGAAAAVSAGPVDGRLPGGAAGAAGGGRGGPESDDHHAADGGVGRGVPGVPAPRPV